MQAFDRFAYVSNNPLKYSDPTGHGVYCGDDYDPSCLDEEELEAYNELGGDENANPFKSDLGGNNELDPQDDSSELTPGQKTGKVVTTLLVEVGIVMPTELVLIAGSLAAPELGPQGILLELVLVPAEIAVADFGISLLINTKESVESGHNVDFEWTLIPKIVSILPESIQEDIHGLIPGVVP